jgi:hypothetical protein
VGSDYDYTVTPLPRMVKKAKPIPRFIVAKDKMNTKRTTQPFTQAVAVTPDNDNDLANPCRALYIGSSGTLRVTIGGAVVNFAAVTAGDIIPMVVTRVHATGTGASGIVAFN